MSIIANSVNIWLCLSEWMLYSTWRNLPKWRISYLYYSVATWNILDRLFSRLVWRDMIWTNETNVSGSTNLCPDSKNWTSRGRGLKQHPRHSKYIVCQLSGLSSKATMEKRTSETVMTILVPFLLLTLASLLDGKNIQTTTGTTPVQGVQ